VHVKTLGFPSAISPKHKGIFICFVMRIPLNTNIRDWTLVILMIETLVVQGALDGGVHSQIIELGSAP
jgi:hypothetical protein